MTEARRNTLFLLFAALVVLSAPDLAAANLPGEVEQGITAYQDGLYTEALRSFRSVLTDSRLEDYQDDAYFWIGKTYLAQGDYDEATRHLEYFLSSFPDSPLRPEGTVPEGSTAVSSAGL
ncbi:tetratricopeptide repeat protein [Marispirochaeta aestuarii]|uniref:tetratricopeptide repeat protein n=1 Tax=Marispirochaeta aestuarii TaxID=1963862 RepID=UPI0029C6B515|nr:tetratricopeptide repeat protein [Marispirochaeta aestuarii]